MKTNIKTTLPSPARSWQEQLSAMRTFTFPEYNTTPQAVALDFMVENVKKLDVKDMRDKNMVEAWFKYEVYVWYPASLWEKGITARWYYKDKPSLKEMLSDVRDDYSDYLESCKRGVLSDTEEKMVKAITTAIESYKSL